MPNPSEPPSPWHLVWTRITEAADELRRTRAEAAEWAEATDQAQK